MTDLPRPIPSDPAEQEAQMPEWVKVEVCRLWNKKAHPDWYPHDVIAHNLIFRHALTIWQWRLEPVDPDLQMAREVCAETWPFFREGYLSGEWDDMETIRTCLAMAKRVREAKQ